MKSELTKETVISILEMAREIYEKEEKLQELFKNLLDVLASSSYPPIIEINSIEYFSKGLEIAFPGMYEDISYFVYEAPWLKDARCTIPGDERKYSAKDINDYADFILNTRK